MAKYSKKPEEVEVFRWTGDRDQNGDPEWIAAALQAKNAFVIRNNAGPAGLFVVTEHGTKVARRGDYVIHSARSGLDVMSAADFAAAYDPILDPPSYLSIEQSRGVLDDQTGRPVDFSGMLSCDERGRISRANVH